MGSYIHNSSSRCAKTPISPTTSTPILRPTPFAENILLCHSGKSCRTKKAANRKGSLRQNRQCPCGEAKAITHLRPRDDDERAPGRYFVQIGHNLDLIVAVLKDVGL
jgi:hypothetical protein